MRVSLIKLFIRFFFFKYSIEYYQKAIEREFACDEQLRKHAEEW